MADGLSYRELYADLVAAAHDEPPAESFGAAQFAEDVGLTTRQALDKLKAMVDAGTLCGDKYAIDGNRQWRFWFPEPDA